MTWPSLHFRGVPQQQRRVVQRAAHVEARDREPLRPRVREERPDGGVQPLRFAQDDVHQLTLLRAERQLVAENLNRARHRRQRVPDLVGDAGGHLADGRQALLQARVAFELLDVGDVLEREEVARRARRASRRYAMLRPISMCWPARMSWRFHPPRRGRRRVRATSAPTASSGMLSTSAIGRPDHRRGRAAGDVLGRAVERQNPAGVVGGRQPARQAVDDVLIERLQIGDLARRLFEPRAGRSCTPSASEPLSSATAKNPNALSR